MIGSDTSNHLELCCESRQLQSCYYVIELRNVETQFYYLKLSSETSYCKNKLPGSYEREVDRPSLMTYADAGASGTGRGGGDAE